jgi:hypothetical protein
MHQSLTLKQICFAPFKFPFCVLALGDIPINEVESYLVEAKQNAFCHNGNVKRNTAFALSNGLQFNCLPGSEQSSVTESLSTQLLGYD